MKNLYSSILIVALFLIPCSIFSQSGKIKQNDEWFKFHELKKSDFVPLGTETNLKVNKTLYYYPNTVLFKPFLKYSPDSSMLIDLDSYSLSLETDSSGKYFSYGYEVDTKVQLVNLSDSSSITVLFCGTLCYPENAVWLSKNEFELYGFHVLNSKKYVPTIWKINTEKMTIAYFQHKSYLEKEPKNFSRQVRLKDVNFISR